MYIYEREINGIIIFDIDGKINLYEAPDLKNAIMEKIDVEKTKIIVNFEKVSAIDSSGIGALISCSSNCKKKHGMLKIINIQDAVRRTFELTRIAAFFEIYDNEAIALASFG